MPDTALHRLPAHGQSIWLDDISRTLVTGGRFAQLVRDACVSGLTSNPTIFHRAITQRREYDDRIRELVAFDSVTPEDAFVDIAVSDVQAAADILRPIFERTGHEDGYACLEVSPRLAFDTEATIGAARMLWGALDRPNVMVKVPATPQGIPAIESLLAEGINVNVTLTFALSAYERVAEAFLRAMERRYILGLSLDVHSVASFFVSRVDTAVDRLIAERQLETRNGQKLEELLGKAAIANAVLVYERFEELFRGNRFARLARAGAVVQRPLWASTSAKNPRYRDVYIAEALIGPDTVTTMTQETIEAFRDHGRVGDTDTVRSDYTAAHRVMERLRAAGIDMAAVTAQLLEDGVRAFADSHDRLLGWIEQRITELRAHVVRRT